MKWYLTKLVFSIEAESTGKKSQFDEQFRLVSAIDESDAYFKAKNLGRNLQTKFKTEKNETINWRFVDVSEVVSLEEIKDGVEVYSNTYETDEKENFINSVLQKGMAIQSKHLAFC